MEKTYDFCGWATRNDLRCSDGRTIRKDAFKENDGKKVPLVWNHQHDSISNVLGHALLQNMPEGVYAYCFLNDTQSGKEAREIIDHGDIESLSIWANELIQQGPDVTHGSIKEVSLVHAGANPGAYIESIIRHGYSSEEEAYIYTGEPIYIAHADESETENKEEKEDHMANNKEKTVADVIAEMTEEQRNVMYALVGQVLTGDEGKKDETISEEEDDNLKHNVFDNNEKQETNVLSHSEMQAIIADAKKCGSLRESFLSHGITNIDYLFPDDRNLTATPILISNDTGWVANVMSAVHHTPFSRVKSIFANLTEEDARAKGYIKGKLKKEEVLSLMKRATAPTTVYKKQKIDRDDMVDIVDMDSVAFLKREMRTMLNEELARAYLFGDGRSIDSEDKVNPENIRPIWTDADLFTIKATFTVAQNSTPAERAKAFIQAVIRARKNYKGSGNPTLYASDDIITECLLMTDENGRDLYDDEAKLAKKLRVKEIVTVPVMENLTRVDDQNKTRHLLGISVNLADYNVGADKGGEVNMFDDFDIDYNAQKYLIETRCSGALTKPYSAIAVEMIIDAA